MSKIKQEAETRCELALMGKVQECKTEEVEFFFNYIKSACEIGRASCRERV